MKYALNIPPPLIAAALVIDLAMGERYLSFGRPTAQIDDVANFIVANSIVETWRTAGVISDEHF